MVKQRAVRVRMAHGEIEQCFVALEVEIPGAFGYAEGFGKICHRRPMGAVVNENLERAILKLIEPVS